MAVPGRAGVAIIARDAPERNARPCSSTAPRPYQDGRKLADISVEDISEYVSRPDCFVWVALFEPTPEELDEMAEEFDLHPLAVEDARKGHQRPKIEEYDDSLFVVAADDRAGAGRGRRRFRRRRESTSSPARTTSCRSAIGRRRGSSTCAPAASASRSCCASARASSSTRSWTRSSTATSRSSTTSNRRSRTPRAGLFDGSSTASRIEELYALKRRLMTLKHAVAPLMESVGKLYGGRVPQMCIGTQEYFRDVYDHLSRINAAIESIREMLATAITVNIALISLSESEVTKRLAAWGALITVPTLIAGIYGMNFEHMPELQVGAGLSVRAAGLMFVVDLLPVLALPPGEVDLAGSLDPVRTRRPRRSGVVPATGRDRDDAPVGRRRRPRRLQRDVVDAEIAREHPLRRGQRPQPGLAVGQREVRRQRDAFARSSSRRADRGRRSRPAAPPARARSPRRTGARARAPSARRSTRAATPTSSAG